MGDKLEIERKFLVEMPDLRKLKAKFDVIKADISQTYLTSEGNGVERRIRKTKVRGTTYYHFTHKEKIEGTGVTRKEHEVEIDKRYYNELKTEADKSLNTIKKKRFIFEYGGRTIELDVYRFWKKQAIVEVEVESEKDVIELPDDIKVIKEVTNDSNYKNAKLAKSLGTF